ncbi:hypothetical protein TH63_18300 [Rufibacter radiotolerans]|uniref:Uncharacterized protein n=1 Tax=Rufibacter radiotolerans TaxID=1379910 RepID=A0A0H4W9L9_9BACT|nr:hypothetical protein TH63_18300 [Rufibacter radiotolerans]
MAHADMVFYVDTPLRPPQGGVCVEEALQCFGPVFQKMGLKHIPHTRHAVRGFAIRREPRTKSQPSGIANPPFRNFRIANPEELNFHSPVSSLYLERLACGPVIALLRAINKSRPQGQCEGERRGPAAVSARREQMKQPSIRTQARKDTTRAMAEKEYNTQATPAITPAIANCKHQSEGNRTTSIALTFSAFRSYIG